MLSRILIGGHDGGRDRRRAGRGRLGKRSEDPSGGMLAQRQSQLDQFADKLKLNKEQRGPGRNHYGCRARSHGAGAAETDRGAQNLAAALIGGQSGDAVDKLDEDLHIVSAQTKALEAKAFGKICACSSPISNPKRCRTSA
jgi:hypothetical protein